MKRVVISFIFFSLFQLLALGQSTAMEYREVRSEGRGVTLKDAMMDALTDAVAQVNGLGIESRKELDSVESSVADRNNSNYLSSESFRHSVSAATKGVIASYSLLDSSQSATGLWSVTIQSKVVVFHRSAIADRKKIVVMPMRLSANPFLVNGVPADREAVNIIFAQSLVSALVQSRRFTVLDREYMGEVLGERKIIVDGNTPVDQMVRLGQELVADYIVAGTLEKVGFETRTETLRQSGRTINLRNGTVEVSYRIIDIDTKQVVYADVFRMNVGENEIRRFDSSSGSNGIESVLCRVAADRIGRQVLDAIYPVLVVSVRPGEVMLGQGGSGLKPGDRFDVYEYGERIVDPYTKESIGRSESYVATLEVVRVNPKQSIAKIIKEEKDIVHGFQPKKYVCREVAVDQNSLYEQQMEQKASERKRAFQSEW